ncbi:MAG: endonuclease III domain-containing protein [Thermoprotei archaeon]
MRCSIRDVLSRLTDQGNLEEFIAAYVCSDSGDFFQTLVATILSQNTTDRAAMRAFNNLRQVFGRVEPRTFVQLDVGTLVPIIRPAGLMSSKAKSIIEAAKTFLGYEPSVVDESSCEELREKLLSIEGVGEKTADVVLLTCFGCRYFPSDTHIKRIFSRLNGEKMSYSRIAEIVLSSNLKPRELLELHHKLITLGRKVCTARKPKCEACPLGDCCEYRMARP